MDFWKLGHHVDAPAAIEAKSGESHSYRDLREDVTRIQNVLPRLNRKSLGLIVCSNKYKCLVAYLAALNTDCAVILLDSALNDHLLREFLQTYQPDWIFAPESKPDLAGYRNSPASESGLLENNYPQVIQVHPDLAVLLTTSGSTGSPKLVRLTLRNLAANAESIAQYLQLTSNERPITALPMSYSYGLSVINSHLHVGASIVLTDESVLQRGFWNALDRFGCTSFAGVPYTYQMLLQTGLLNRNRTSLKTLTQAGGRLEERYIQQMYELVQTRDCRFFVMYGQTEATARISYVPYEELGRKIGSVGIPIPNGSLIIDDLTGELIYRGPNVMMGYAESPADLAKGDEMHGELRTGDLARKDSEGYFYITGRLKRFLKMFGKRFNLDDAEKMLSRRFGASVACYGRDDLLMVASEGADIEAMQVFICETFGLPRSAVKIAAVKELPRTRNGKLDYTRLVESGWQQGVAAAG